MEISIAPLTTHAWASSLINYSQYQTNVHILWSLHLGYTIIGWYNVCRIEFSIVHVSTCDVVDACSVHLSEHVHYASIKFFHLKLDFITLYWRVGSSVSSLSDPMLNQLNCIPLHDYNSTSIFKDLRGSVELDPLELRKLMKQEDVKHYSTIVAWC